MSRQRLVGINHVALGVDDVDAAVEFYGSVFELPPVNRIPGGAFLDLGDQFVALFERGVEERHFGLVVPDKEAARRRLQEIGAELPPGRFLDFRDPSGNRVQIVQYDQIQFTKAEQVLRGMGLALGKSDRALAELRAKGLA
jgi:catechol 2,3-dioxygenase-like lactoylglutathione lyase family enzyme